MSRNPGWKCKTQRQTKASEKQQGYQKENKYCIEIWGLGFIFCLKIERYKYLPSKGELSKSFAFVQL